MSAVDWTKQPFGEMDRDARIIGVLLTHAQYLEEAAADDTLDRDMLAQVMEQVAAGLRDPELWTQEQTQQERP